MGYSTNIPHNPRPRVGRGLLSSSLCFSQPLPTTDLPRLVEGQPQGDGGDEEDAGSVVVIGIADPQHDAEHLEDVEGVEYLEREQVLGRRASSRPL